MISATPATRVRRGRGQSRDWLVPAGLVALSAIPLAAGTSRLIQLAGGPDIMPADDRFAGFPTALVLHILGAGVFALLGIAQLVPGIRRRHRVWHRRAGRVVAVAGLAVAGSALWLTLFYAPQPGTGDLLSVLRVVVSTAMVACIVLGFTAIRRRDVVAHRAWMIRAYALGLGAGTQAFTEGLGEAFFGTGDVRGDLYKAAAWVINLAVAEWAVRRPTRPSQRRTQRQDHRSAATAAAGALR